MPERRTQFWSRITAGCPEVRPFVPTRYPEVTEYVIQVWSELELRLLSYGNLFYLKIFRSEDFKGVWPNNTPPPHPRPPKKRTKKTKTKTLHHPLFYKNWFTASFDDDNDDAELFLCLFYALFPAGTIVRETHHRKSPTRREQGFNLRRIRVQTSLNEVVH